MASLFVQMLPYVIFYKFKRNKRNNQNKRKYFIRKAGMSDFFSLICKPLHSFFFFVNLCPFVTSCVSLCSFLFAPRLNPKRRITGSYTKIFLRNSTLCAFFSLETIIILSFFYFYQKNLPPWFVSSRTIFLPTFCRAALLTELLRCFDRLSMTALNNFKSSN